MKRFYYFLYTFVMAVMLWMVLYGGFTLWQNKNLPSFFYDISTWFAYDELFQHEKVVRGSYHHVENGYYIPQGNTIYALLPGIVIEEENELVMVSDKGIKVIYHFKGNVKIYTYVCVYIYVCVYVCMYTYMYMYTRVCIYV